MANDDSHPYSVRFKGRSLYFYISGGLRLVFLAGLALIPNLVLAQWNATAGAQSHDLGKQGLAFLPNEIWIHAGDSITWTVEADEPHTVTFLANDQLRPPFTVGCPGFSTGSASFDGTNCITSSLLFKGEKLTVVFPVAGNFKLVCLLHDNMTGTIHVLDPSEPLPHDQAFYDGVAQSESKELLGDEDAGTPKHHHSGNTVIVGHGEITATAGGSDSLSVMRFTDPDITVHAGDTIEWTNEDPITAHTVTFGPEPEDLFDPSANVTIDADGARHAVLSSTSASVHSGFIQAAPQERVGLAQAPSGVTRFRVTFAKPGTYPYICSLHDVLGMKGTVIVLP